MKNIFLLLFPCVALAGPIAPTPFPVFLRQGYSSILEFEEVPTKVVLGDGQSFQIEKLDRSLVIKTLVPYASTNMFVYFKTLDTRLFLVTASEDAEPTYYKKFETIKPPKELIPKAASKFKKSARTTSVKFDTKKDYLVVELVISSDSSEVIKPDWKLVRLSYNKKFTVPMKLWAERQEVQKDSQIKARFVFAKPNVPRNLKLVSLVVPLLGSYSTFNLDLSGGKL